MPYAFRVGRHHWKYAADHILIAYSIWCGAYNAHRPETMFWLHVMMLETAMGAQGFVIEPLLTVSLLTVCTTTIRARRPLPAPALSLAAVHGSTIGGHAVAKSGYTAAARS
jgi:hypothetical protein